MKQKTIGSYYAGRECIELVIREGQGGEVFFCPEHGKIGRIKIGVDDEWRDVLAALFHEVFEFIATKNHCRYQDTENFSGDLGTYMFIIPHYMFSDICWKTADFMEACVGDLKKKWEKWQKEKR